MLPISALRRGFAALLSLGLALNGLSMLLAPQGWYQTLPGVSQTGPFNAHFVADIAAAYLAAALAAGLLAWRGDPLLVLPAAAFLLLHAGIHLADSFESGHSHGAALLTELGGVYLPALLAVALALPWRGTMRVPGALMLGAVALMEKAVGVRLDYLREMAARQSPVLGRMLRLAALSRATGAVVPAEVVHFAALGATRQEDCGECLQIGVNLARGAGSDPELLQAALDGCFDNLPPHLALAFRFGMAVAANDPEMEDMRVLLEQRYGRNAVMELSYSLAMARFYPTVKRALGYAKSCSLIQVKAA